MCVCMFNRIKFLTPQVSVNRAAMQDQGAKLWAPQVSVNRAETQDLRGPTFGPPKSLCVNRAETQDSGPEGVKFWPSPKSM